MSRGGMKKDDAIALAGSVAAKAVYTALEQAEDKKDGTVLKDGVPVKDPVKPDTVQARRGRRVEETPEDDSDTDDDNEAPPIQASQASIRSSLQRRAAPSAPVVGRQFLGARARSMVGPGFDRTWQPGDDDGDYEDNQDVHKVLDSIPKDERASVLFKFRQRKLVGNGKIFFKPVAEHSVAGPASEWQARIKAELAAKGPGHYEGIPHTTEGKPVVNGTHWVFEIKEDEAREAGWSPEEEKPVNMPVVTAAPQPSAPAFDVPVEDDMEKLAKREKSRIEYLKHQLDCTKLENQLAAERDGVKKTAPEPVVKESGLTEEAASRIIEAEKARLAAEHKAELARLDADRKAELARFETDRERAETRLKEAASVEQRKAEDALRDLKADLVRKETEHAAKLVSLQSSLEKQFDDKFGKFEKAFKDQQSEEKRDRSPERKPEETAVAVATALTNAFSPLLTPLMNAWATKMNQPPPAAPVVPAAPDPVKQMESMAKIFAPLLDRATAPQPAPPPPPPAPPPVDTMAIVTQTMSMFKDALPKPERAPKPEELADMIEARVSRAVAAQIPHPPQQPPQPPQDQFAFADRMFGFAKGMAETMTGRGGQQEEREEPADQLEIAEKTFDRLRKFGVPITIGVPQAVATSVEPTKPNYVGEIFAGVKETLPAFGDAVAKYMNSRQPAVDPETLREVQIAQLKKKTGMRPKAAGQGQARPQQRQQAPRQPQQAPQQPQQAPVQRQFVPPQANPVVAPQPRQPVNQAPRPVQQAPQQQVPQQPQSAQPQVAQQGQAPAQNRFLPTEPSPYNLPTEVINQRPPAPPGFKPVETVPQRAAPPQPQKSSGPVDYPPTRPPGNPAGRIPAATIPAPRQQQVRPPQRPPARPMPAAPRAPQPVPAQPRQTQPQQVQAPAPQQTQTAPVQQQPQQVPQQVPQVQQQVPQQVPQVQQQPEESVAETTSEELDAEGLPTMKVWSELATYAIASIDKNEDTDVAALYLLEHFPKAAHLVKNVIDGMGVEALDALLMNHAHNAGPNAEVIGGLASKIRNQGKDWATRLAASLGGSSGTS